MLSYEDIILLGEERVLVIQEHERALPVWRDLELRRLLPREVELPGWNGRRGATQERETKSCA